MSQSIDPSRQLEFKTLQVDGKKLAAEGKLTESLRKFELAKKICPTPKILQRIEKIKECLSAIKNESIYKKEDLSSPILPNDLPSEGVGKVSSKKTSSDRKGFVMPNVLNDIQNVQKSNVPHTVSKSTDLSPDSQTKFRGLKKKAKELAYAGEYDEALKYFRKALTICDCPNVKRYIQEIQLVMSDNEQEISKIEDVPDKSYKQDPAPRSVQNNTYSAKSFEPDESDRQKKLDEIKILYEEARDLAADGRLSSALKQLKKAQSVMETQKVQKKIEKLEALIETDLNDSVSNKMVKITEDFSIFHDIYDKLYPYQREGVAWMWNLYKMGKGGVLGDDMGLGKTFQVIAFLSGMIDADRVKHVLIIMPVSLIQNWTKEFKKWCPGIAVHDFHSGSKKERERNLFKVQKRGHVLLTSYGMVVNNVNTMTEMEGREFVWDYVILDEGHKIKNPTKTTKAVYEIPSKNRLVLTGTPIQNNLRELWSLYDFVHQGTLLGSQKTFKMHYENPITRAREKDATAGEKQLGTEMAENLKSLIKPYFLRRLKDEIWGKKTDEDDVEQLGNQIEKMMISKLNAKKNDLILWTYMSEPQIEIYKSFLHSDAVKSILVSKRSPLVELTTLKKICDHPRLLSQRACLQLGLNGDLLNEDLLRDLDDEATMASSIDNVTDETLLIESGKLKLVIELLENLKETGHRTLVFSLSRKILDMIHRILVNRDWKVMRLDGTISKTEERERRIQRFQNDPSYPVFLLTTQVGGVGITLTAADRVIIYDPSWNPATDAQAVDRVYRIGQEKHVVVYRLITCGSVEEKIYRRQIFKDSITKQATGAADPYRYFSKQELRELFSLDNPLYSATQVQLSEMHSSQRQTDDQLERHIEYLQTLNIFGISDHDLMFSKSVQDHSEDNDQAAVSVNFIKKQVATAHELIKMEASVVAEGIRLAGTYNRPYQETVPLQKKSTLKDTYKPPVLPEVIDLTEHAQDAYLSSKQNSSLEVNISNVDITTPSPGNKRKGGKQYSSPIQTQIKNFFLSDVKEKAHPDLSPKDHKSSQVGVNGSDKAVESKGLSPLNTSCNIEKLRKSLDCLETSPIKEEEDQPFVDGKIIPDIVTDKNINVSVDDEKIDYQANVEDADVHSLCELEPLKLNPEFQEKFRDNLTQLMYDDLKDLSFDPEVSDRYVKGSRKSCARKSTFMLSDSDTSHQSSNESNSHTNLVDDSEDAASEVGDPSNSISLSFVPDSAANTPETVKLPTKITQSVSETPPRVFCLESESLPGNSPVTSNSSFLRKLEGSVRRITPLKVDKHQTPENSSFVQAMASSLILTPYTTPEKGGSDQIPPVSAENLVHSSLEGSIVVMSDNDDSPIKFSRKKKHIQICSDSEESDNEQEIAMDQSLAHSEVVNKSGDDSDSEESDNEQEITNDQSLAHSEVVSEDDSDSEESDNEQEITMDQSLAHSEVLNKSRDDQSFYSVHSDDGSVHTSVSDDSYNVNKQLSGSNECYSECTTQNGKEKSSTRSEASDSSVDENDHSNSEYSYASDENEHSNFEYSHASLNEKDLSNRSSQSDTDESESVFSQNTNNDSDSD